MKAISFFAIILIHLFEGRKLMKRTISIFLAVLMLLTSAPLAGFIDFDWSAIRINPFSEKAEAASNESAQDGYDNEVYYDGWSYSTKSKPKKASSSDAISKDEIEISFKGISKSSGEEVDMPGATVTLYVDGKPKYSKTDNDNDGKEKISIAGLTQDEIARATVSAYKKTGDGKGMDGTARDVAFQKFKNAEGKIIRYEYELHSERVDDNGNWIGEEISTGEKVDISFLIDATGSMSGDIRSVKDNIASFSEKLINAGMDIRFSIIEYRDITCGEQTVIHTFSGSKWTSSLSSITSELGTIYATGGGDTPETVIDALGAVASSSMNWRSDAHKYALVFTDADYKNNNTYGYSDLAEVTNVLYRNKIHTSVVTSSEYQSTYFTLYNTTGGTCASLSSSYSSTMNSLAENIIDVTKRRMTLVLKEPRIKYNLSVCYFADDDTSRSDEYRENMKRMLREYANDIAQTSDGHAFINKIYLFSTANRMDFFDTSKKACMADIQIQSKEKEKSNDNSNVCIHSFSYAGGYYKSKNDVTMSKGNYEHFDNINDYKSKNVFRAIFMSGNGVHNYKRDSFTNDPKTYAETLTHESGHYVFGFRDEYQDQDSNNWTSSNRPYSEYGLMDHQNDGIELSKSIIEYSYFNGSFPTGRDSRHTEHSFSNGGSCEDTLARLLEEGTGTYTSLEKTSGSYKATYTKSPLTDNDRTASYDDWFSVTFLTDRNSSGAKSPAKKATAATSMSISDFDDATLLSDKISDTIYSVNNGVVSFALTPQSGKTYSAYIMANGSDTFEALSASTSGSKKVFTYTPAENDVAEIRIVEQGDKMNYFKYYVDTSESTDTGYIYNSVDSTTAAYEDVSDDTILIHISDASSKTNGDYVSVNNSTYISADEAANIDGGEIYSVASCVADIDYTTLSWFVFRNGTWTKLSTDTSSEENNNIGARADTNGEGLYVLMAKRASSTTAESVADLNCEIDETVNGRVSIDFDDSNTDSKFYNVFYSELPFASKDDENVSGRLFDARNGSDLILTFPETNKTYYIAVEVVTESGAKSELTFSTITPKDADRDEDGIPDNYCDRYSLWGTDGEEKDIANSDDDNDGLTNLEEYRRGSDPTNPNDPVKTLPTPVQSVSVSKTQNRILINTSFSISATILPKDATNKNISWETDNDSVVKLTPNGSKCTIKGIGTGSVNVYAVTKDGGYAASCEVTVYCDHTFSTKWTVDSPATTSSTGSKSHHCTVCGEKKDVTSIPRIYSYELSNTYYFADGKKKTPTVTVKDYNDKVLVKGTDYTVAYSSSTRTAAGSYYVTITFKGDYSGTRTLYFYLRDTVSNLRRTESSMSSVTLTWDKLTGASGYIVLRKLKDDKAYKQIAKTKSLTYTDKTIKVNKEYYYVVRPYNSEKTGVDSSYVTLSTLIGVPSLYIYTSETGSLQFNVYKGSNSVGYQLFRSTSETGKYSMIKSSSNSTYYDTGLTVGKTYFYKARSVAYVNNKAYYSEFSTIKSASPVIFAPTGLKASASGETSVKLSWDAMSGVNGYDIYRSEYSGGSYLYIGSTTGTAYTDKGLTNEKSYYYKIVAYKTISGVKNYSSMSGYVYAYPSFTYPYDVEITNSGLNTHTIKWTKPSGAKGVELSISEGNSYDYKVIGEYTGSSYTNKNIDASKYYYYKLRSYKVVSGEKVYSSYYSTSYKSLLPQVAGLKASNRSLNTIRLSWSKVSNATIYFIYRSTSLNGYYSNIGTTESLYYDMTDLPLDTRYYFKVEARRNINGYVNYGIESSPVCKTVLVPATTISSIKNISSTSLKISWGKVADATSYTLYKSTSKGSGFKVVKSGLKSLTYTDTGLKYGTTYYYKIITVYSAEGLENKSAFSGVLSKKTALAAPTASASSKSLTSIKVSWNKDPGVNGYEIYRSEKSNGSYSKIKTITKNSTVVFTNSKLKSGKTYYYKVRSFKTVNKKAVYSPFSKIVSAKAAPESVTGLKATAFTTTSIKLAWNTATDAKYYQVEQSIDGKNWKTVSTVKTNSVAIKNLTAGTKYQFRVTSLDSTKKIAGNVSAVLKTGTLTKAPAISKLTSTKSKQATVTWGKVTGAKSYIVYTSNDGKNFTAFKSGITGTSCTITKLTGGKKIYVKVIAVNAYGAKSAASTVKNVTVKK